MGGRNKVREETGDPGGPCQAGGSSSLAAAQMGAASKGSHVTDRVKESSPLPTSGLPSWRPGLWPRRPEQRNQVTQAHPGRGGSVWWGFAELQPRKAKMRSQEAAG